MPDGLLTIGNSAFNNCGSLTSVTVPESVVRIMTFAFADCESLEKIIVSGNNKIYTDNDGVLFNKNKMTLVQYPAGKTETEYSVPDTVKTIGMGAFIYCKNLKSVKTP